MKAYFLIAGAIVAGACSNAAPVVQNTSNANSAMPARNERPQTVTAHSSENRSLTSGNAAPGGPGSGRWSASGDPIDTAKFDGTIAAAEQNLKNKPSDEQAKKDLAQAYYDRGAALTEARQYAAALGDYRRALKHDPNHEESKNWIGQIETIYRSLNKAAPKEGEEPAPLPFKKG